MLFKTFSAALPNAVHLYGSKDWAPGIPRSSRPGRETTGGVHCHVDLFIGFVHKSQIVMLELRILNIADCLLQVNGVEHLGMDTWNRTCFIFVDFMASWMIPFIKKIFYTPSFFCIPSGNRTYYGKVDDIYHCKSASLYPYQNWHQKSFRSVFLLNSITLFWHIKSKDSLTLTNMESQK